MYLSGKVVLAILEEGSRTQYLAVYRSLKASAVHGSFDGTADTVTGIFAM